MLNSVGVENIIVSNSKASAESLTDLTVMSIDENSYMKDIDITWIFYDQELRPVKPFNSWIWDTELKKWTAPVPIPLDLNEYTWNEENFEWDLVTE